MILKELLAINEAAKANPMKDAIAIAKKVLVDAKANDKELKKYVKFTSQTDIDDNDQAALTIVLATSFDSDEEDEVDDFLGKVTKVAASIRKALKHLKLIVELDTNDVGEPTLYIQQK